MRSSFTPILVLALFQSAAFALPTNSTLHFLSTRAGGAGVCAQNFRTVGASDCIPVGARFTQDLVAGAGGPTVTKHNDVTAANVPAAHQCDHIVEIQTLGNLLNSRGVCTALAKAVKVRATPSIATLLSPLENIISSRNNLFFLSDNVNNKKGTFAKSGSGAGGTDVVSKAVKDYLTKTETQALGVATQLDTAISTLIANMRALSAANPPPAKAGRLTPADAAKRDLALAVAPATLHDAPTLHTQWQAFVASFP